MTAPRPPVSSFVICHSSFRRMAFTLVEVLAAIAIIAIVLPVLMNGLSVTINAASLAKHRTLGTTLAQSKLDELIVTRDFQTLSGDFGDQVPGYRWKIDLNPWSSPTVDGFSTTIQQLDVTVSWTQRNQTFNAAVSTLLYQNSTASTSSGLGGLLP